ncbi:MAG: nucleoside-diphosphate sugar epimerase/dehydratase [Burkholderiaceae bacterium]|nr:nucleoside-diphosphate sugar epimerase/dehydratase [Burkholderiaceae bacterium]
MISHQSKNSLLQLPRYAKRLIVLALDLIMSMIAVWLAFYLRIDQVSMPQGEQYFVYLLAPLLAVPVFTYFGLYRAIFRYTGMAAMLSTGLAVGIYALFFFSALFYFKWDGVPRSLGLIQPLIFLMLVGGSRAVARYWLAGLSVQSRHSHGRLLIYGAGEAGVQTATALAVSRQYKLMAYADNDAGKVGGSINGVRIIHADGVAAAVERFGITDILLAIPSIGRSQRNDIISKLRSMPVHVRTLPSIGDLAAGRVTVQDFQELDVEDLLGRPPVAPDKLLLAQNLSDKVVLVTGAGGSIGGELCRQILLENPAQLVLLEHNEFGLYTIHSELLNLCRAKGLQTAVIPLLASVGNFVRLREIFQLYKPATVYHAAAYKHVPLVESNPAEGVLNNVFGTMNTARAAMENGANHFVLISTDKAVRPTNVMGATKRMAELVLQALAANTAVQFHLPDGILSPVVQNSTVFSMVRFGNVLGSSGSVVPLFRKQLLAGGPITVTHADVTRYFMTIPEAAQLVLQAGAMSQGGDVFVLDMGQPIKIIDLAKQMAQLAGYTLCDEDNPAGDIKIEVTGLRPGEKLYEELLIGDNPQPTHHQRIMKANEAFEDWQTLAPLLVNLRLAAIHSDTDAIKTILKRMVSGYMPQPTPSLPFTLSIKSI